jgi:hypothetical protein
MDKNDRYPRVVGWLFVSMFSMLCWLALYSVVVYLMR